MRTARSDKSHQPGRPARRGLRKQASKERRTAARPASSYSNGENGNLHSGSAVKSRARQKNKSAASVRPAGRVGKTLAGAAVVKEYSRLPELGKRQYLKKRHEEGASYAELAAEIGRSKSLVRDMIALASLPEDIGAVYSQGKLGRKKAIRLAGARKQQIKETATTAADQRSRPPGSQVEIAGSAGTEASQNTGSEEPILDAARNAKESPQPTAPLQDCQEERRQKTAEWADRIVEWFPLTGLGACDMECFFVQVNAALYGRFPRLFSDEAPRRRNLRAIQDPWKYIKRCKTQRGNPNSAPDLVNSAVAWLARWAQRLIPDREMMKEAIARAHRQLALLARKDIWG